MVDETLIDTSLLLEPFGPHRKDGENYKEKALTIIRYAKVGFVKCTSISVLGELNLILNREENNQVGRATQNQKMKDLLDDFCKNCKILPLKKEAIDLAHEILEEDNRLDPMDVLHFSTAICEKCSGFMFMDGEMQTNKILRRIAKQHNLKLIPFNANPENKDKGKKCRDLICLQGSH